MQKSGTRINVCSQTNTGLLGNWTGVAHAKLVRGRATNPQNSLCRIDFTSRYCPRAAEHYLRSRISVPHEPVHHIGKL